MEIVKFPTNLLGNSKALYLDLLLFHHIGFDYFLFLFLNFITLTIQLSSYKYIITKTLYKTSFFSPNLSPLSTPLYYVCSLWIFYNQQAQYLWRKVFIFHCIFVFDLYFRRYFVYLWFRFFYHHILRLF